MEPNSNWYCIVTNPNCQRRAEAELAQLGYRTFWPKVRKWVSHARSKTAKEYPLLGRYLFVEVAGDDFGGVRTANGVESFVNVGGRPMAVPRRWVEDCLQRYINGEWDFVRPVSYVVDEEGQRTQRRNPKIPIGARVRIMEGEFANMLATVRARSAGKLQVVPLGNHRFVETWPANVRAA